MKDALVREAVATVCSSESADSIQSLRERVGVVAIGRNEGERLRRCLASVRQASARVAYVDSGSTDGSVEAARAAGATVISLDMNRPFTAARARNEGFRHILRIFPDVEYVQFVDGDCEVVLGWIEEAASFLDKNPGVAAVCGRRRERFPDQSIYNRLCDIEWDTPVGLAEGCGGDVLIRKIALAQVDGYRESLIAGEDTELGVRLRARGWQIWRLDKEMTVHDAAITRFGQWWKRTTRAGFAYAECTRLHGWRPERHRVRESRSALFWGLGLPFSMLSIGFFWPTILFGFMAYPVQIFRLFATGSGTYKSRSLRALFLVLGKFPEALGQVQFTVRQIRGGGVRLIEYK